MILSRFPYVRIKPGKPNGWNGRNYFWGVVMMSEAPLFGAVLAQEVREWGLKFTSLVIALGAVIALSFLIDGDLRHFTFFLLAVPLVLWRMPFMNRLLEYHGHAAECYVANRFYQVPIDVHEKAEAAGMVHHYSCFRDMEPAEIEKELAKRRESAKRWCVRWDRLIQKGITNSTPAPKAP